jgi:CHAT domain-containing protein/tetratricopeptide (TPR) repeat protein
MEKTSSFLRLSIVLALGVAATPFARATAGAPAAPPPALTAVLTRVEGNVTVQEGMPRRRSGSPPIRRAQFLQVVSAGDEIRVPAGAGAVLVCSIDRAVVLTGGTKRLTDELCRGGASLPTGAYQGLAPHGGRLRSVAGALVVERLARSPDERLRLNPILLRPRNTVVLEPRPEIVWTQVETATDYKIEMRGDVHFAVRLPADQVHCDRVAGAERGVCSAHYPASEPELPPGASALLQISASRETGGAYGEQEPLWLRRLPAEKAVEIAARVKTLASLPVGETARWLLQADLYARERIYADAIDLYRQALALQGSPEVRVTLGDVYLAVGLFSEAARVYQEALSAAGPAVRAAAMFGLGRIEQARGKLHEARLRFEEASKLYSSLGYEEEAAAARKAAEEAREEGRRTFDALLQKDPKLMDPDVATALVSEWTASLHGVEDARERARILRELGSLYAVISEASRRDPDAGMDANRRSEDLLRNAVRLLSSQGDPADPDLTDAKLRLAQTLTAVWCPESSHCDNQRDEALAFAEEGLRAAHTRGRPAEIAAALRVVARVQIRRFEREKAIGLFEEALRLEPAGSEWSLGRVETLADLADLLLLRQPDRALALLLDAATGCIKLGLPAAHRLVGSVTTGYHFIMRPERPWLGNTPAPGEGYELHEAVRFDRNDDDMHLLLLIRAWETGGGGEAGFELADHLLRHGRLDEAEHVISEGLKTASWMSWNEGWALQLMEAEILFRRGDAEAARVVLTVLRKEIVRSPSAPHGFNASYWLQRSLGELVEIDMARCDIAALRGDLRDLLAAEQALIGTMIQRSSEAGFRSIAFDLAPEEELFAPAVQCGSCDPDILRTTVDRVLLRREIWRYRTQIVGNTRGRGDPKLAAKAEGLVALRKLRAQLCLRVDDEALAAELKTVRIPYEHVHPAGVSEGFNAFLEVESAIDFDERELADAVRQNLPFEKEITGLWTGLIQALGADGALLGYLPVRIPPGTRRLVAFVVDGKGGISWADLGDETVISRRLDGNWARLVARTDDGKDALRRAGEDLFDPIGASLEGRRKILLLASGPVRFLPWNAMVDSRGRFLGDRFSSIWLQSAADTLPDRVSGDPAPGEVVLLAPEYATMDEAKLVPRLSSRIVQPGFRPLPGVRDELGALEALFKTKGIRHAMVSGGAATETSLRSLRSPLVLHIAAHGFRVPPEIPLLGGEQQIVNGWSSYWPNIPQGFLEPSFLRVGVALSGANRGGTLKEDDGLLTASEAADLDLRGTSLVVLSGCETAYPTLQDSGGAYDLSLGFRMAGARSVVGSLWRVDDRATSLLMTEMYRRLTEGESVADALWQAKQKLRSDPAFSHPYFWAPFQILGTGKAVWAPREYHGTVSLASEILRGRAGWQGGSDGGAPAPTRAAVPRPRP